MFLRKKKKAAPVAEPRVKQLRFHVRAYPEGYGKFRVVLTDRSKTDYIVWQRIAGVVFLEDPHEQNRRNGHTTERGGFTTRADALKFAYRIIRMRLRWEDYVERGTLEIETDGENLK